MIASASGLAQRAGQFGPARMTRQLGNSKVKLTGQAEWSFGFGLVLDYLLVRHVAGFGLRGGLRPVFVGRLFLAPLITNDALSLFVFH